MTIISYRGEYVYDVRCEGFYVCECAEVSSYVYLYVDVDAFEDNTAVFYVLYSALCLWDQSKKWLIPIIEVYGFIWYRCSNFQYFLN